MLSQDGPKVLQDISFHIKSGERVGVGESQLSKSLFCLLTVRIQWVVLGPERWQDVP